MKKLAILVICLIALLAYTADAKTINVPEDFNSIQQAINAANAGDKIVVRGYFTENVVINKQVVLLGLDSTIDGGKKGDVIKILAKGVKIAGFKIKNSGNRGAGIHIASDGNEVFNNVITNNYIGIKVDRGKKNVIRNNKIKDNRFGLYLWLSRDNKVYLNEFANQWNVFSVGSKNVWNSTLTEYTFNGVFRGYLGNYYDDYIGHDLNDDGIGDLPYLMGLDRDTHPLMNPPETYFLQGGSVNKNKPPIADFISREIVEVNEVVNFDASSSYDPDGKIVEYIWEIDGKTLYGKSVSYKFSNPGLYNVKLTVVDDKDESSFVTKSVRVLASNNSPAILIVAPRSVLEDSFEVSIVARNVSNLGAFMIKVTFDPGMVKLISVKGGSDLPKSKSFGAYRGENSVNVVTILPDAEIAVG